MAPRIKMRWIAVSLLVALLATTLASSACAKSALIERDADGKIKVTYSYGDTDYSFGIDYRRNHYPGYYRTRPLYSYPAYLDHFPRRAGYLYGGY